MKCKNVTICKKKNYQMDIFVLKIDPTNLLVSDLYAFVPVSKLVYRHVSFKVLFKPLQIVKCVFHI